MKINSPITRIYMLGTLLVLIITAFFFRLLQMQVVDGAAYTARLTQGYTVDQTLPAARGEILDRYGRPLAVNRIGFDLTLSRALLPRGKENDIILHATALLVEQGEEWTDNLPITREYPYLYTEDSAAPREALIAFLGLGEYASASDSLYWLVKRYGLDEYSPQEQRRAAGIRYELERQGFSMSQPYTLANDISIETVSLIKQLSLDLPGVQVVETAHRYYQNGSLAPHLVGRVGPLFLEEYERLRADGYRMSDEIGKDGIELSFESELRGQTGIRRAYLSATGKVESVDDIQPPVPGNTVVLTLDTEMQRVSIDALANQIAYLNATAPAGQGKEADSGAVAVINIKTGEILALVTYPSYNLETFNQDYQSLIEPGSRDPLFNRALSGMYAPGSCFKPVVGLAGLNDGITTPSTTVLCTSVYTLPSAPTHLFTCLSAHGNYNIRQAIRESCNIYFYDVGRNLGIDTINKYARELGLGVPTGVELPETKGSQSTNNPDRPGDTLQTSIGQMGNAYSPLQLASYTATMANNGTRMELSIIKQISSYNFERTLYEHSPRVASQSTIALEHFETLRSGMIDASHIGTARNTFAGYPITVASKTGTPQTLQFPNSVFIAYAPAEDPQIAVAVIIEKGWHGYTGAPVAKAVFDYYFFSDAVTDATSGIGRLIP